MVYIHFFIFFSGFCIKFPTLCPQAVSEEEYFTADERSDSESGRLKDSHIVNKFPVKLFFFI